MMDMGERKRGKGWRSREVKEGEKEGEKEGGKEGRRVRLEEMEDKELTVFFFL